MPGGMLENTSICYECLDPVCSECYLFGNGMGYGTICKKKYCKDCIPGHGRRCSFCNGMVCGCEGCGELEDCDECGGAACQDCLNTCDGCNMNKCTNCSAYLHCDGCHKSHCADCYDGKEYDVKLCEECGSEYCSDCTLKEDVHLHGPVDV